MTPAEKVAAGAWLKPEELAELFGMSAGWVRERVTAREIPFHRAGRYTRFSPADVRAIERSMAVPAADRPRLHRTA